MDSMTDEGKWSYIYGVEFKLLYLAYSLTLWYEIDNIIAELDSTKPKIMTESRIMRIARGSGHLVHEVMEMLEEYKRLAKGFSKTIKSFKIPKNAQNMSKVLSKMSEVFQSPNKY